MVQPPRPSAPRPVSFDGTDAHARFADAMRGSMKREWVTHAMIALNVGVFVLMVASGVDPVLPDDSLVDWGANEASRTLFGEPWRLVTSMFVHGGLIHLGFNMYFLSIVGRTVERLYGHAAFALLYAVAGLSGSLASALWNVGPSVGASGAAFGTLGALLAFLLRRRSLLPPNVLKSMRFAVIATVVVNVGFGLSVPGIDNAAHLGGLGGGFFVGLLLAPALDERRFSRPWALYPVAFFMGALLYAAAAFGAPLLESLV